MSIDREILGRDVRQSVTINLIAKCSSTLNDDEIRRRRTNASGTLAQLVDIRAATSVYR